MKYFLIHNSDGDTYIEELTGNELIQQLNDKEFGENIEFLESIKENDTNYWGDSYLIIKGEIFVPKIKKVIEEYSLDDNV